MQKQFCDAYILCGNLAALISILIKDGRDVCQYWATHLLITNFLKSTAFQASLLDLFLHTDRLQFVLDDDVSKALDFHYLSPIPKYIYWLWRNQFVSDVLLINL